jgi:hypothetical protein
MSEYVHATDPETAHDAAQSIDPHKDSMIALSLFDRMMFFHLDGVILAELSIA